MRAEPWSPPDLLVEAARWRLLSLLLLRPTAERKAEVRQLAGDLGETRVAEIARAWSDNASEGAYLQLLGPGGLVPARTVAYRPFADPGWILADLSRNYRAFGFHDDADEPPDHIAVLADFVAYLLLKEAYARHCGDEEAAEATCATRKRIAEEHLSPMAGSLAERLDARGATEWSAAARMLADEVPPPPAAAVTPHEEEVWSCGNCVAEGELE